MKVAVFRRVYLVLDSAEALRVDLLGTILKFYISHVKKGDIHGALNSLSFPKSKGVLSLDDQINFGSFSKLVRDVLSDKHPPSQSLSSDILLPSQSIPSNSVIFDSLDAAPISRATMRTQGAAGPSGLDAYVWRRLCTQYESTSGDLCSALAVAGRKLCCLYVDPVGLEAFTSSCLIPLNKDPGVRPIRVGEVPRCIISKAIL